jgi:hypothetical protein
MVGPIVNGESVSGTGKEGPEMRNGKLQSPDNVIVAEHAARTIYTRLTHAQSKRCFNYERIQGMIDGNPPYNPLKLKQAGLSDMSNVNWKDGEATFQSVALAYWSLFNDVERIAEFHVDYGDDEALKAEWGKILADEWDVTLRQWPNFSKHMSFHQSELIKFGFNAIVWPDEEDWRFKPINIRHFYVPDQTSNDIEELSIVLVEHQYTAQFLWGVYEEAKSNPRGVWDAEALGHILYTLATISDEDRKRNNITDCESLQRHIRNGDLYQSELYNSDITLVSLFSKEFDEKITHQMIHPGISTETFIYFLDRQYDDIRQALVYFTWKPGEETIHGNKGLGHSMFSAIEAITQLDCSVLDQAKRSGSLLIKGGPQRGRDERQIRFVHGGVIDVGEATIEQNTMGNNVGETVEVSRYFKQKILANNNVSGTDPAFADRNIQSARQIQLQATKEARVQKNMIYHYYETLDHMFREIVRKMLLSGPSKGGWEYVSIWKERCIDRGVPEELFDIGNAKLRPNGLPVYLDVVASRSAGSGSQIADQLEMKEMMAILPTLGERGRTRILQDYIAAFRGFRFVPRYFPEEDRGDQPVEADTLASIENNQLADGKQIIVSPDNNHSVHAPNHVRLMRDFMDLYQQNPQAQFDSDTNILQKCDDVFQVAGPHLVKHLFHLQGDPTRAALFQELNAQWAVLANFGDQIANNAARQREAEQRQQQQQQQAQAEQDAQNTPQHIKARGDIELKQQKMDASIERDRLRDSNKFALERENIERKTELDRQKAQAEVGIKAIKELSNVDKNQT